MVSRATHYRNVKRHSQLAVPQEAPAKKISPEVATSWIPEYVARLTSGQVLTLADPIAQEVGEAKLREISRRGLLHMQAVKADGVFSHFSWIVK